MDLVQDSYLVDSEYVLPLVEELVPDAVRQGADEVVPPDGVVEVVQQPGDLQRDVDQLHEHRQRQSGEHQKY